MSRKLALIITGLVLGGLITGATYAVGHHNPQITCTVQAQGAVPQSIQWQNAWDDAHPPIRAQEKGFPFSYYRQPFPADCIPNENISPQTGLMTKYLVLDYLIWALAALAACGIAFFIKGHRK
jgi:hypothetical protein